VRPGRRSPSCYDVYLDRAGRGELGNARAAKPVAAHIRLRQLHRAPGLADAEGGWLVMMLPRIRSGDAERGECNESRRRDPRGGVLDDRHAMDRGQLRIGLARGRSTNDMYAPLYLHISLVRDHTTLPFSLDE